LRCNNREFLFTDPWFAALLDAESHPVYFAYDVLGRLASETDAISKSEYYTYDAVGNLIARTDGDSQTSYYVYDALDRHVRIDFPEGGTAYFDYDEVGNLVAHHEEEPGPTYGYGTQPYGTSPYGGVGIRSTYYVYDALDRVVQRTIPGVGTLYFEYDLAGRRTMINDWDGVAVYYQYDKRGLITEVHSDAGWTYYTYDPRGAVLTRHLPNGSCTYYAYDDGGRLSKLENRKSDGDPVCTFEFTRDPNGNILTSLREDNSCWYYEYDGLQRLTAAEWKDDQGASLYAYEYDYDKVGNRSHLLSNGSHTYYTYNEANELTVEETPGVETAYYTYDGRGNQTQRKVLGGYTTYFEYNSRNLITRIDSTDPTFTTPNTFEYNGLRQRVQKVDSTGTTKYLWDGLNIILELDANNAMKRRYTHGHADIEGVASLIDVEDAQGDHYFYHFDQVGGVRNLTDESQGLPQYYEYSPYGRIFKDAGSAPNDFVFPGTYSALPDVQDQPLSPTRQYDARTGRFLDRDSSTVARGNRYVYSSLNPIRGLDPSGYKNLRWSDFRGPVPSSPQYSASVRYLLPSRVPGGEPTKKQACKKEADVRLCKGKKSLFWERVLTRPWEEWYAKGMVPSEAPTKYRKWTAKWRERLPTAQELEELGCYSCTYSLPKVQYVSGFDPARSWVIRGRESAYLLGHEQGHLEIMEAYAKRIQAEVRKLRVVVTVCSLDGAFELARRRFTAQRLAIWRKFRNAAEAQEKNYDRDTDHSRNKTNQAKWLSIIEGWLKDPSRVPDHGRSLLR